MVKIWMSIIGHEMAYNFHNNMATKMQGHATVRFMQTRIVETNIMFLVVEDLPLVEKFLIVGCESLKMVLNLPKVRQPWVSCCPSLRRVEELDSLEQLWLDVDMKVGAWA